MSQNRPGQDHVDASAVHGDQLLQQLRHGWKPLPTRTLISMVIGGLKVRLMRSVVTMVSIVLAIAFLTYTGLANQLSFNLASAAGDLESFTPVDPAKVAEAAGQLAAVDIVGSLSSDQQRSLAKKLGMDRVKEQEAQLLAIADPLRNTRLNAESAAATLADLKSRDNVVADDVAMAQERADKLTADLNQLIATEATLSRQVHLGHWLANRPTDGFENPEQVLTEALKQRQLALFGSMKQPGRLTADELEHVRLLLALPGQNAQATSLLETALAQQQASRSAGDLRTSLRRAGINIQATLEGNPLDTWLIVMALLTCTVGIANAMLMSVTERFREIGTMKCLGAQDGLVVKLFLLESAFQGIIGALLGIALGLLVGLLAALLQFGGFGWKFFPWTQCVIVLGWALLAGMALAVGGAILPAWQSALMRPVDALRVDE